MTTQTQLSGFEYRSKQEINGWPLIHINVGNNSETGRARIAKGIVAIGNTAFGVVSIGGAAFGVVALGGFGLGIVSLAGFAAGIIAFGPVAVGYEYAVGAVVLSAKTAIGVIDVAKMILGVLAGFRFML